MKKESVTIKELSKFLNLGEAVLRVHLCRFDKYKMPHTKPWSFKYNYSFLLDLKNFYLNKCENKDKRCACYEKVVKKLDKIIKLWDKKIRANLY